MLALAGCGTEQESTAGSSTAAQPPASPSTSVPVVGGPSPHAASSTVASEADETSSEAGSQTCGSIPGPDGALRIMVLSGDVECSTAKKIAEEYGPKIATGQKQSVSGWTCGPSEVEGILAACQSDSKVIGFTP